MSSLNKAKMFTDSDTYSRHEQRRLKLAQTYTTSRLIIIIDTNLKSVIYIN